MDIITTSTISHLNDLVINGLIPIFVEYINNQYHIDITEKELEVVLQSIIPLRFEGGQIQNGKAEV